MESNPLDPVDRVDPSDPATARGALDAIADDQAGFLQRVGSHTRWTAPAQGFGIALLVAAPAVGMRWGWLLYLLGVLTLIGTEVLFRTRTGVVLARPAGRRSLAVLIALLVALVVSVALSTLLAILGESGWVLAVAAAIGIATVVGAIAYDRAYASDLLRGR